MMNAAYKQGVLRVVPVTLLVASFLTVEVHAQRSVATFQGHAAGLGVLRFQWIAQSFQRILFPEGRCKRGILYPAGVCKSGRS
jgi:hypothetical protein